MTASSGGGAQRGASARGHHRRPIFMMRMGQQQRSASEHMGEVFRIGTGAGFSADRLGPAVELARKGRLDAMIIECIGERTMAFGHRDRMANPSRAAERTVAIARELGLKGLKVACIEGDEVSDAVASDALLMDEPGTIGDVGRPVVGMNAYVGI